MKLADAIIIKGPKDQVCAALKNPQVLKQFTPGCEELIQHSDTELVAKVVLEVGPVKVPFGGEVTLHK